MMKNDNVLVVSAHAADFVWRSGGTMAKYIKAGAKVSLVILSYGVRGESNDLWKAEGQTAENVKSFRAAEVDKALECLGITDVEFWDLEDYNMDLTNEHMDRMVKKIRKERPSPTALKTHSIQTTSEYPNSSGKLVYCRFPMALKSKAIQQPNKPVSLASSPIRPKFPTSTQMSLSTSLRPSRKKKQP